jgi:hypothetical protein
MHQLKVIDIARRVHEMPWIPFCMLLLVQSSTTVLAQESNDPMEVCYRMSDADLRHACFDREMQRRHAAVAESAGPDGKQPIINRKEADTPPAAVKPLSASIARLKPRPGHLYYFELDNGQVWESTDSEADLFVGPHEKVLIRPGVLGAFFLKTPEGRSIRVHRLR